MLHLIMVGYFLCGKFDLSEKVASLKCSNDPIRQVVLQCTRGDREFA